MPVTARIDWVSRQINMGRKGHVVFSEALDPCKLKIRIVLNSPGDGALGVAAAEGIKQVLQWTRQLAGTNICVDRGHKFSSGISEVCIWVKMFSGGSEVTAGFQSPPTLETGNTDNGVAGNVVPPPSTGNGSTTGSTMVLQPPPTQAGTGEVDSGIIGSTSLDTVVAGSFVPPPRKRVRFSLQEDVAFMDEDSYAPQTLEQFLADAPATPPAAIGFELSPVFDELKQVFLKQTAFLRDNFCTMQETVVSSWPSLPAEQH